MTVTFVFDFKGVPLSRLFQMVSGGFSGDQGFRTLLGPFQECSKEFQEFLGVSRVFLRISGGIRGVTEVFQGMSAALQGVSWAS